MGSQSKLALEAELTARGYSTDATRVEGKCALCEKGVITYHKDETPGFKESWITCSTQGCKGEL